MNNANPNVGNHAHPPLRLHHNAFVVRNQEVTRQFYEDVLGFTLTAFWIEDTSFEGDHFVLSHAFYSLQDGSALAFFNFADPVLQEKFRSVPSQVFQHLAMLVDQDIQDQILARLITADWKNFTVEHGYCRSLYVTDPDGLRLEFAVDSPHADEINDIQRRTAHDTLRRWLSGDRQSNNVWREH